MLNCDSKSVIHLAKNLVYHAGKKHMQVCYHFIRLALEDGVLILKKIQRNWNLVDILTKTVMIEKLELYAISVELLS